MLENRTRIRKRKNIRIKERGDGKEEKRRKAMFAILFFTLAGLRFLKKIQIDLEEPIRMNCKNRS